MAADESPTESDASPEPAEAADRAEPWSLKKKLAASASAFMAAVLAGLAAAFAGEIHDFFKSDYRVAVETNRDAIPSSNRLPGGEYIVDRPVQDVPPPPLSIDACNGRHLWARSLGGIDVHNTLAKVSVTAASGHQVQVVGVERVPVGDRRSPAVGTLLGCPGGGEVVPVRHIDLNLDTNKYQFFDGKSGTPVDMNLSIGAGTTEVVDILAHTLENDWTYRLELKLLVDGKAKDYVLSDSGRAFRTSAGLNAKHYRWTDGRWALAEDGPLSPTTPTPPAGRHPCKLLTAAEVAAVVKPKDTPRPMGGSGVGAAGVPIDSFQCTFTNKVGVVLGIVLSQAKTPQDASREFEKQLELKDRSKNAAPVLGLGDAARLIDQRDLLVRRGRDILSVYITRGTAASLPSDAVTVERLGRLALSRF